MASAIDFLTIIISGIVLWWGANLIVSSATRIAHRFGISDLIIGLTVVAFGTSAPEFSVTVIAAISGHSNISVSNVIGSNFINLGFVLGFVALIQAIKTTRSVVKRDGIVLIIVTGMLYVFLLDYQLSHWEGIIFVASLIVYNVHIIRNGKVKQEKLEGGSYKFIDIGIFIFGMALIAGSSHLLVESAVDIAEAYGVSEWTIGQTIVAFGTSVPEFATSLAAAVKGRHGMSVGNLVGSNLFNILGVLGLASIIRTMTVDFSAIINLYLLIGFTLIVVVAMRTDRKVSRIEGGILVAINLAIWVLSFFGVIG